MPTLGSRGCLLHIRYFENGPLEPGYEMPNHDKWSHPWTVHPSRLLMSKNFLKKVIENLFLMFGRGELKTEQKLIVLRCHSPPYLFWREIGTQSHSAKLLNWGDHVLSVPDLAAARLCLSTNKSKHCPSDQKFSKQRTESDRIKDELTVLV